MKHIELKYFLALALSTAVIVANSAQASTNGQVVVPSKVAVSQHIKLKIGVKKPPTKREQLLAARANAALKFQKRNVGFDTKSLSDYFEILKKKKTQPQN